jgi:hypothetical protein
MILIEYIGIIPKCNIFIELFFIFRPRNGTGILAFIDSLPQKGRDSHAITNRTNDSRFERNYG